MKRALLGAVLLVLASLVFAQVREFPMGAKRAKAKIENYPMILINGKERRLAPGARIWNPQNLIEIPSNFYGVKLLVNYTQDMNGDIDRVWVLSDAEARLPAPEKRKEIY